MFGRIVGGLDTLSALERVDTDNKDRPIDDLIIERTSVFVDPFAEADEALAEERRQELEKNREKEAELKAKKKEKPAQKVYTKGVGKFINPSLKKEARKAEKDDKAAPAAKKKKAGSSYGFSNFGSW